MSHGIIKPYDRLFSTRGTEWHGMSEEVSAIDAQTVAPLLFPIVEGEIMLNLADGAAVRMEGFKALAADFRAVRPDLTASMLAGEKDSEGESVRDILPLHIPRSSYSVIPNSKIWECATSALRDIDGVEITSVGTLEAGKKFFISCALGNPEMEVNGEKFLAHVNFITSHDGTLAVFAYDSTVRIVCMNTLRWSLDAAGEVGFRVYHSKNADTSLSNVAELLNAMLAGREKFRDSMGYLASVSCDNGMAREIAIGYLMGDGETVATRTVNAGDEIASLFVNGRGNKGQTMYDLLNGATEYWTSGAGTGKNSSKLTKFGKAEFGAAADHKNAFCNLLMSGADAIEEARERARKALAEYVKAA